MKDRWVVHKFGGTSVADAGRYGAAADIVLAERERDGRVAVVVSAMRGVTDALIEMVTLAAARENSYADRLRLLRARHLETLSQLGLPEARASTLAGRVAADCTELAEVLRGVWIARFASEQLTEFISGYGELWSAQLLHARLELAGHPAAWLDAREVLVVEPDGRAVSVAWEVSRERLARWLEGAGSARTVVITGFIASTRAGVATTLKRDGSDYSASIFAALLGAESVTIWTDVDGVLSADPRRVPDALVVPRLSYAEAAELAYFGAKVIHPNTMSPVVAGRIPVHIRNSLNPAARGTTISAETAAGMPIKGFATVEGMTLINVEGTGMVGVPGIAHKLFGALRAQDVSVVLISQGSSEHSICFAVPGAQAETARRAVEEAFLAEIGRGQVQTIGLTPNCCILAVVGDGMVDAPGVAGQFFTALGRAGVSVRAIAQGASERNISAVIAEREATRALRAAHSAFYLSSQTLSVGVVGTGLIGGTFLNQLWGRLAALRSRRAIDVRVRAVMNSRRMLLDERRIDLSSWEEDLRGGGAPDLEEFAEHVAASHLPHACIIDATASAEVAARYESWLERGINVITPNKKGNTGPLARYLSLREVARRRGRYFLYETNVGAGLPVIHTLRDLLETGDEVIRVEGVLSGTLSYIFNSFDGTRPFSEVVREAHARGYTEPDPREDLCGIDVARKLVILAREMGLALELDDAEVESLVPEELRAAGVEEYMGSLSRYDAAMAERLEAARARREVLRYVGWVEPSGRVAASLRALPLGHPFASLSDSDNVVSFRTARYNVQPMIVRGPGAGPDVTAAGVFADLLRLASFLGAPQ